VPKPKTENENIFAALEALTARVEDIFILEACRAGIKQHEIRALLGIDMRRVSKIAKHVKEK
jgi:hypothetical protein